MEMSLAQKRLIYFLFALSGCIALVYEVLWTKYLILTFGATIEAVSVVAATFMAGLAIGSWLFGRFADRKTCLLKVYAGLEAGIALFALLFAPTLNLVEWLYVALTQNFASLPILPFTVRAFFSALLLLPPTICMGGTFPLMCRFFARRKSGGQIGRLYAMNTLGATLGAFAAGFVLIPGLGLSVTCFIAIFINLAIAGVSLVLAQNFNPLDADGATCQDLMASELRATQYRLVLISIGLIGFFSLAYEILWTRVLLLFLGNTSYAFSLMLCAYLVGIAGGGFLYARLVRPHMDEVRLFLLLTTLMGLTILITAPFYDQLAYLFQFAHQASGERWWHLSMLSFLIVFLIMALPTVLSGALLPAAVAIIDPGKSRTGEGVGLVVLHNTLGAVLGSLVAGFFLVPVVGLLGSFHLLAILNLSLAVMLAVSYRIRARKPVGRLLPALLIFGLVVALLPSSWNQQLMNSGVYCYAPKYEKMGGITKVLQDEKILEVIEGRDTTVAILESTDGAFRFFTVNGKTDGGTGRDMATQVLVGHLPLLLHPAPSEVLVIGLGTGITLRGMSAHPTSRIDCVEISPEVVRAEKYFREANGQALKDPKVSLLVNDGRNLLLTRPDRYDVIVSEPSNPWQSGNANLFTDDFYQLAAKRLKEGGIFCQWIGLYDITLDNLKIACRTFLKTFPRVLVFQAGSDLIMVGARQPLEFDYQQLRQRFAVSGIRQIMEGINLDSPGDLIASRYLFSEIALMDFCEDAECLNTDDRPILEFSARYNLGQKTLGEYAEQNSRALMMAHNGRLFLPVKNFGQSKAEVSAALLEIGQGYARIGRKVDAATFMRKAAEIL